MADDKLKAGPESPGEGSVGDAQTVTKPPAPETVEESAAGTGPVRQPEQSVTPGMGGDVPIQPAPQVEADKVEKSPGQDKKVEPEEKTAKRRGRPQLMGAVVQYAKTRPVFDGYKAARYSKKYLAQHEAELSDYRAAKAAMSELLDGAKLPKMDALKKRRRELSEKKKALYAEYRKAQADMREAVAVKGNIDFLRGYPDGREDKAQER